MNKLYPLGVNQSPPVYVAPASDSEDKLVDIDKLIQAVRRRMWLIIASFVATFSVVTLISFQMTPIYSATSRIIVDSRETNVIDVGDVLSGLSPTTGIVNTEVEVIKSRALLMKVVERLNLDQYPEFNYALRDPTMTQQIRRSVNRFFDGLRPAAPAESGPASAPPSPEARAERRRISIANALGRNISVNRIGATLIIDVTARSESPTLAADIANTVADQYRVEQLEAKFEATRRANEWLDERLGGLRGEVNAAASAVEAYRSASGLLAAGDTTLTEQRISDLEAQLVVREGELEERRARLNNVRAQVARGDDVDTIAEVLQSSVISNLRAQQAEVLRRKADLQTRYGPRHPELRRVNSEEADINAQIEAEVSRIVANLESEVTIARQRVSSLASSIGDMRSQLVTNNRALVRLRELEREAEASQSLYEEFLARFKETREQDGIAEADARVLSQASVPSRPSFPNTNLNLVLAVLLGAAVAGGLALLAEMLDNYVSSPEDIERFFDMPSMGMVPLLTGLSAFGRKPTSPADYLLENPLSAFAESIRNLRASIIFADLDRAAKTVAVSSSLPDEGKTSLVYCLGRMSALSGAKTLIIDGDFRRRQLTEMVGIEPETGFIEHLFGEVSLEESIHIDDATGLHVLPLTDTRNTPRDVFGSRAFDTL